MKNDLSEKQLAFWMVLLLGAIVAVMLISEGTGWPGELQDKQRDRELLAKDLRIVELQMERDTARLDAIKERFPRLQRERMELQKKAVKLNQEIKALEEVKKNEKDTSSGDVDSNPADYVPPK